MVISGSAHHHEWQRRYLPAESFEPSTSRATGLHIIGYRGVEMEIAATAVWTSCREFVGSRFTPLIVTLAHVG